MRRPDDIAGPEDQARGEAVLAGVGGLTSI